MQFAARFNLTIDPGTAELSRSLRQEYSSLAVERVWGEWHKWATRSRRPSRGPELLRESGWLEFYPELAALQGVPQDPEWHPEGDVWMHTMHVCDAAAVIAERDQLNDFDRSVLLFSALCHDLGKPATTEFVDSRWRAHGHCEAGVVPTRRFLERIGCPESLIEVIEPLVAEHLAHVQGNMTPRFVRRLSNRLGKATISQLVRLIEADLSGRPPLPVGLPESAAAMADLARTLDIENNRPVPIVQGRHLIALGHRPDVWFGEILKICYESQLDGIFESENEGVTFVNQILSKRQP